MDEIFNLQKIQAELFGETVYTVEKISIKTAYTLLRKIHKHLFIMYVLQALLVPARSEASNSFTLLLLMVTWFLLLSLSKIIV